MGSGGHPPRPHLQWAWTSVFHTGREDKGNISTHLTLGLLPIRTPLSFLDPSSWRPSTRMGAVSPPYRRGPRRQAGPPSPSTKCAPVRQNGWVLLSHPTEIGLGQRKGDRGDRADAGLRSQRLQMLPLLPEAAGPRCGSQASRDTAQSLGPRLRTRRKLPPEASP